MQNWQKRVLRARSRSVTSPEESKPPATSLSRRRILAVAGGGLAAQLVGCRPDLKAPPAPGTTDQAGGAGRGAWGQASGGGGRLGGGGGDNGGGGHGGRGGDGGTSGGGHGGGAGPGGNGGGAGAAGSGGSETGAAPGEAGVGPAPADGGSDFANDARIEVGGPGGASDGASAVCRVTSDDELGPYYLRGAAKRDVLATPDDGQMMVVTGRVLDTRCRPLAGAELDIWSTNDRGEYSTSPDGWGRGRSSVDSSGWYRFETVLPGAYLGRPRHLHFIVSQPGHDRLTTQMYFQGERPDIPSLAVTRTRVGGLWQCHFDIVLAGGLVRSIPARQRRPSIPGQLPRRFWAARSRRGNGSAPTG